MPPSAPFGRLCALAFTVTLIAVPGVVAADYESEWDPIGGMGRCTSVDNASAERVRKVIASTTAMVTLCMQCDDVRPRRRDPRTLQIVPFNGGTLNTIHIEGHPIDLAQTFVMFDETKFDDLRYRVYTSAPFKNLALLADCPTFNAPVLRGLHVDEPEAEAARPPLGPSSLALPPPAPVPSTTIVVQQDDHVLVAAVASLCTLLAASLVFATCRLVQGRRAMRARAIDLITDGGAVGDDRQRP